MQKSHRTHRRGVRKKEISATHSFQKQTPCVVTLSAECTDAYPIVSVGILTVFANFLEKL